MSELSSKPLPHSYTFLPSKSIFTPVQTMTNTTGYYQQKRFRCTLSHNRRGQVQSGLIFWRYFHRSSKGTRPEGLPPPRVIRQYIISRHPITKIGHGFVYWSYSLHSMIGRANITPVTAQTFIYHSDSLLYGFVDPSDPGHQSPMRGPSTGRNSWSCRI